MEVDRKLLEHVAEVARIKLNDGEIKKFLPQLKEILEFFSKLKDINTDNVKPSFQPVELKNAMREDNEGQCLSQDDALSLTEHKKDAYFKGPKAV
ncbi:Asp-tRNA(Asn)/Glu-tRNA(Gln) amidotransferase subunit GatC [Candidatus Woesearchaeota archaeon]|nr:Asp-tRNA(Asn)/Glu-tRNA(Gln) amidotransferase subunit GatC [Candidatus Woesearchaeota archaeon]